MVSVEVARLQAKGCVAITISQSGQSPDIGPQDMVREAGAPTVALVNDEVPPVATNADICPACGAEVSVAACAN